MKPVRFSVNGIVVEASHGQTILDAIQKNGILIDSSCEGGTCGACRVWIEKGLEDLPDREEPESETAEDRGFLQNERLACQVTAKEGLVIKTPKFKA